MIRSLRLFLLATVLALTLAAGFRPAYAACGGVTPVATAAELDAAIADFNGKAAPCDYAISITTDITLTNFLPDIHNEDSLNSLTINGNGYTLDFDFNGGLQIYGTNARIEDLTVTRGSWAAILVLEGTSAASDVEVSGVTFTNSDTGLRVYDNTPGQNQAEVEDSLFSGNGFGIIVDSDSYARVTRSSFENNETGALVQYGKLVITDSLFANNTDAGVSQTEGEMTLINTTVAGNDQAVDMYDGDLYMAQVTITGNQDGIEVGAFNMDADLTVYNSVVTGSNGVDCEVEEDFSYTVNVWIEHSLVEDTGVDACGLAAGNPDANGNIVGQPGLIAPLGDYGGPTLTAPPLVLTGGLNASSPAIDAGDNDLADDESGDPLDFDQRGAGFPRIVNSTVDMGAFEGALAIDCPTFPVTVANEDELNEAVICYNHITTPGDYAINLQSILQLSGPAVAVDNDAPGVALTLQAGGWVIDANDIAGVRPLTVLAGEVTVINAVLTGGNVAGDGGGAYNAGDLTIKGGLITYNAAGENGGGVYNEGELTLEGVQLFGNTSENNGAAVFNNGGDTPATATLTFSLISENTAVAPNGDGGGIANEGVMTIADSEISGNRAEGDSLVYGGGIFNQGDLKLLRATVGDNSVALTNDSGYGGGIANEGYLLVRDSLISDNRVEGDIDLLGGGIYSSINAFRVEDGFRAGLWIINSTISGNTVTAGHDIAIGGGLYARDYDCCSFEPSVVSIVNSTISDNAVDSTGTTFEVNAGGAAFVGSFLEATIHNSILANSSEAGNPGGDCTVVDANFSAAHSLFEDTGDGACGLAAANPDADGNIVGVDPALGPLGGNGGPTATHALLANSPARDKGDNALAVDENGDPLPADQRGFVSRAENGTVDMGAYEFGAEPAGSGLFVSAVAAGVTGDGLAFGPHDILKWDGSAWSKWFDGTAAGLASKGIAKHHINAFWIPESTEPDVVISFTHNRRVVPGIGGFVDGMDLVWWDGSTFSLWFDGQDVGLTNLTQEKIDGLHVLDGGVAPPALAAAAGGSCEAYLLISTQGPGRVPNYDGTTLKFGGEDVLGFCLTQAGANTQGKWIMVLDGSAEGMPRNSTESLVASDDGQTLFLTTRGTFIVDSAAGGHSMVYEYDFATGEFSGPYIDFAAEGLPRKVAGLHGE